MLNAVFLRQRYKPCPMHLEMRSNLRLMRSIKSRQRKRRRKNRKIQWKIRRNIFTKKTPATKRKKPQVKVIYCIGWQRRASGNLHNSLSSHAFMIGVCTGNFLSNIIVAKECTRCGSSEQLNNDTKVNDYLWNYKGIRK